MRPALSTQRTLAATAILGMLLVGGCGGSDDDGGGDAGPANAAVDQPRDGRGIAERSSGDDGHQLSSDLDAVGVDTGRELLKQSSSDFAMSAGLDAPAEREQSNNPLDEPEIIYQASVEAHADDVSDARFDALKVMGKYGGTLAADETTSDEDGEMRNARMAIRVPSTDFDAAYADLQKVGDNIASHSGSEDVTTEVIDVEARIRAQEQSLARIEALLAQAQRLRTVIAIESQLARRQADLDSLKSRQAYLEDQTSQATIVMFIERTPEEEQKEKDEDDKGFLAGLDNGWDGLVAATVGIATVIGVLLPFAIVLALLGVPLVMLVRRLRPVGGREPAAESAE